MEADTEADMVTDMDANNGDGWHEENGLRLRDCFFTPTGDVHVSARVLHNHEPACAVQLAIHAASNHFFEGVLAKLSENPLALPLEAEVDISEWRDAIFATICPDPVAGVEQPALDISRWTRVVQFAANVDQSTRFQLIHDAVADEEEEHEKVMIWQIFLRDHSYALCMNLIQ